MCALACPCSCVHLLVLAHVCTCLSLLMCALACPCSCVHLLVLTHVCTCLSMLMCALVCHHEFMIHAAKLVQVAGCVMCRSGNAPLVLAAALNPNPPKNLRACGLHAGFFGAFWCRGGGDVGVLSVSCGPATLGQCSPPCGTGRGPGPAPPTHHVNAAHGLDPERCRHSAAVSSEVGHPTVEGTGGGGRGKGREVVN